MHNKKKSPFSSKVGHRSCCWKVLEGLSTQHERAQFNYSPPGDHFQLSESRFSSVDMVDSGLAHNHLQELVQALTIFVPHIGHISKHRVCLPGNPRLRLLLYEAPASQQLFNYFLQVVSKMLSQYPRFLRSISLILLFQFSLDIHWLIDTVNLPGFRITREANPGHVLEGLSNLDSQRWEDSP